MNKIFTPYETYKQGEEEEFAIELDDILKEIDLPPYPDLAEKEGVEYTDYLTGAHDKSFNTDKKTGKEYIYTPDRNRQCSIGYHLECSDPSGNECGCPCHKIIDLHRSQTIALLNALIEEMERMKKRVPWQEGKWMPMDDKAEGFNQALYNRIVSYTALRDKIAEEK